MNQIQTNSRADMAVINYKNIILCQLWSLFSLGCHPAKISAGFPPHTYTVITAIFSGELTLDGCHLIIRGVKASYYGQDALHLTQPSASKYWRINGHRLLQATGCTDCHPTKCQHTEGTKWQWVTQIPPWKLENLWRLLEEVFMGWIAFLRQKTKCQSTE